MTGAVELGSLRLPSGGMIGMIVRSEPSSPDTAVKVAEIRSEILAARTAAGARRNTASQGTHGRRCGVAHRPGPG